MNVERKTALTNNTNHPTTPSQVIHENTDMEGVGITIVVAVGVVVAMMGVIMANLVVVLVAAIVVMVAIVVAVSVVVAIVETVVIVVIVTANKRKSLYCIKVY